MSEAFPTELEVLTSFVEDLALGKYERTKSGKVVVVLEHKGIAFEDVGLAAISVLDMAKEAREGYPNTPRWYE
jgi:hypothetical protein